MKFKLSVTGVFKYNESPFHREGQISTTHTDTLLGYVGYIRFFSN